MENKVTFGVKGMSCGHCKMAVEKALKGIDGVLGAEVNLEAANVSITYNDEKTNLDQLKDAVKESGYQPE